MRCILLNEIRKLEKKALALGAIEDYEVRSVDEMKKESWERYKVSRLEYLEHMIRDKEIDLGLIY